MRNQTQSLTIEQGNKKPAPCLTTQNGLVVIRFQNQLAWIARSLVEWAWSHTIPQHRGEPLPQDLDALESADSGARGSIIRWHHEKSATSLYGLQTLQWYSFLMEKIAKRASQTLFGIRLAIGVSYFFSFWCFLNSILEPFGYFSNWSSMARFKQRISSRFAMSSDCHGVTFRA